MYLPLIDMIPSDPNTILTALHQAQEITTKCGQEYVVFTGYLQYKVAVNILWAYPEQFGNVIMRLGGMHTLMSFVGSVGTLMAGSGLYEILESTFGGVLKMMSGKKFPQNLRALRLVTEELLHPFFSTNNVNKETDIEQYLTDVSNRSRTSRVWVDCLIRAVFIMMLYVRAEREACWCLHLVATQAMLPYFFAAGHVNYARYGLYYLRTMENMPPECQEMFLKGEHTMRHVPGIWNGIWSDMYIETTFMRYGHGKRGIIGVTLKPETLKTWSVSLHICSRLEQDIANLIGEDNDEEQQKHKEERKGRITTDKLDRESIRTKLQECIDPLNPDAHPVEIVNIVTGKVADGIVNVDKAVEIGTDQMKMFERTWPEGFRGTLSNKVKTQATSCKYIKVGENKVFDTELIYSRVIGLQTSSRDLDVKQLLSYELSPVPTSMFKESGEMRVATSKSVLKKTLQKEVSARLVRERVDTVIIDGSAFLYVLRWPQKSGTVGDFVVNYRHYIEKQLHEHDVYLVFDRYREYSTKGVTQDSRGAQINRVHHLTTTMPIPTQKEILCNPENKSQMIALIVDDLCTNTNFPYNADASRSMVVTGNDPTPIEVTKATKIRREDMRTTHEEADNILAQQMVAVASEPSTGVCVISDDTDVFVLLLYFYLKYSLAGRVLMESPVKERTLIDIKATVQENRDIIKDLPAAHALTGSDTTASYHGIGKATVVKVLRTRRPLSSVGDTDADIDTVIRESTLFVGACYNVTTNATDMSSVRQKVWTSRVGRSPSCAPKLCSLPPTTESFKENVKRAHLQACIWKHADEMDPPEFSPDTYGWERNTTTKSLVPIMLPSDVPLAPPNVLKLIKCSCESQQQCSSRRCRCYAAKLPCTMFCACEGGLRCCNEQTVHL